MGNLSPVTRLTWSPTVSVIPVITASSAYGATNQLGGIITISNVVRQDHQGTGGTCELRSIEILDINNQKSAIDFWFFNTSPTLTSTDHTTMAMTAANFKAQCIGAVSVGTTYSSNGTLAVSSDGAAIGRLFQIPQTATSPANLYAVAICQGTPTYTTTSSLVFNFSFYVD